MVKMFLDSYVFQIQTCRGVEAAVGWIWSTADYRNLALVDFVECICLDYQSVGTASFLVNIVNVPNIGRRRQTGRSSPTGQGVGTTIVVCSRQDTADSWHLRSDCKKQQQQNIKRISHELWLAKTQPKRFWQKSPVVPIDFVSHKHQLILTTDNKNIELMNPPVRVKGVVLSSDATLLTVTAHVYLSPMLLKATFRVV